MKYLPSANIQAELVKAGLDQFCNGIDFEDADWNAQRDYFRSHPIHAKESDAEIDDRTGYFLIWRDHGVPQDKTSGDAVETVNAKRITVMHEALREMCREHFPALRQDFADVKTSSSQQANAAQALNAQMEKYISESCQSHLRTAVRLDEVRDEVNASGLEQIKALNDLQGRVLDSAIRISKVALWAWLVIVGVLLAIAVMTAFSVKAHAQIDVIQFQDSSGTLIKTFAAPFKIKCSTNLTCTPTGSTMSITASASGATAFSGITAATNSNAGSFIVSANTWDFSAATLLKLRVAAGLTSSVNGDLGYDTTNKNWHIWANAVDNFIATIPVSVTVTSGHLATWSLVSGVLTLNDGGAVPSGGTPCTGTASSVQYNNGGAFGCISTMTTDGTIVTAKVGADWLFVDPTSPTKKFSFDASNITAGQTRTVNIPDANSTTVQADTGAANNFLTAISAQGVISKAQPAFTNLSGSAACSQMPALTGDVTTSAGACATTNVNLPDGVTQAGSLLITDIAAPASPAAAHLKVFGDSTDLRFHDKNAAGTIGTTVVADTGAANNYISAVSAAGVISKSRPACATLSDSSGGCTMSTTAGGDLSGTLPSPTVAKVNGIAYSATAAAHTVEVITTANTTATAKVIPDCTDATGNHLNYTQSTDSFSCGTTDSHVGTVTSVSGTANEITSSGGATPALSIASTFDIHGKTSTAPIKAGTIVAAPASCQANVELYIETDATAGQQVFICNGTGNGWNLVGDGGGGGGGVTSIATTSPITGGTITNTGTIACATCVTSAASLTSNALVVGGGSQASAVLGSLGTTTTVLHGNAAGVPSFGAVVQGDVTNGFVDLSSGQTVAGAKVLTGANTECSMNGVFYIGAGCASTWGGGDIGAQANTIYSGVCATQSSCTISVIPQANGACYSYTTPIVFNTIGEEVLFTSLNPNSDTSGNIPGGACISFTTTAGNAASSGTGAESTNTVTLTFAAVPSGLTVNNIVNVTGCSVAGYNGFWRALTVTSTTFTYTNPTSSLGAATTCTATISPAAVTLDWTPGTGGGFETGAGISNLLITNGTTYTTGGGGFSSVGVRIGNANGGAHDASFASTKVAAFGVGVWNDNLLSWGQIFQGSSLVWNTVGGWFGGGLENVYLNGGRIADNGTGIISNAAELTITGLSFDSNTVAAINGINANGPTPFYVSATHFENLGVGGALPYIIGNVNLTMDGGDMTDDTSSGDNALGFISLTGNTLNINKTEFSTSGRTESGGVIIAGGFIRGDVEAYNQSPTVLTKFIGGSVSNFVSVRVLNGANVFAPVPWWQEAPWGPATTGRPNMSLQGFMVTPGFSAPTLACSNSGGSLAAATHFFKFTFVNGSGETTASSESSCATTGTTGSVVVTAPSLPLNATGYTVYDSNTTNTELKQAASGACANITGNCTVTVLAAGAALPGSNTASSGPTSSTANSDDIAIISSDGTIAKNIETHVVAPGVAGALVLYDSGGTNTITHTTSGTVTSYTVNHPLAAATGVLTGVNASNVITWAHSGDAAHSLSQLAKTAAVTTFTLCAATANTACGQAGQYRISYNFYGSGTACATVTAGSVGLNLTWTDTNAVTHTTISLPLWDQKSAAMTNGVFNFNTALGTEGASGSYIISTNGTIIQAATTYVACTSGTGAYNLKMTVEQLQ